MIKNIFRNKAFNNNFNSLIGNTIQASLGFISFLILVRYTDKQIFGQWIIFLTVATLLDMLRLGLTGTATVRFLATDNSKNKMASVGASYQLSISTTIILAAIFFIVYGALHFFKEPAYYKHIFLLYPLLSIANLPFHQATVIAQGEEKFKRISLLKLINGACILTIILISTWSKTKLDFLSIIYIYIAANTITSLFIIIKRWDGLRFIKNGTSQLRKSILKFGKYSTASYIGSNLLKSTDTLILGLSPFLGAEAVAVYAIPFKFVEMVEILIRSFSSTAYPKLSHTLKNNYTQFFAHLLSYAKITTLLLIPASALLLFFPNFFLQIMGGTSYASSIELQKSILIIICVYILILPADRFTGVALFAMNRPRLNFIKITIMLIANILFDLIAVFVFNSLTYVALATLLFTLLGLITGWYFVIKTAKSDFGLSQNLTSCSIYNLNQIKKWIHLKKHILMHK